MSTITIGLLVGIINAVTAYILFFVFGFAVSSSHPVEFTDLLFWGTIGGVTGGIIGAIFLKNMKLSLLATLWTGIIVGAIPLIIYIDQIANARYNVLLIEGFAVLFNIGIFLVVFPSFGVLCSLFLYILWKSIEILIKKIAIELK